MKREPLFNIPLVILMLLATFALVHVVCTQLLTIPQYDWVLENFAFIPARYDAAIVQQYSGGVGAEIWTFVTYAFLHGSWGHLGVNAIWLLPFGSAVARRFGAPRFIAFFVVTAAAGALAFFVTNVGDQSVVIGASAAISGTMAAAIRFAFQRGGPLGMLRGEGDEAYRVPALPLVRVLSDARVLIFLGVWFGINIIFGVGSVSLTGSDQPVAWQAHIGGFLAGLLLFSWFDPAPDRPQSDDIAATRH